MSSAEGRHLGSATLRKGKGKVRCPPPPTNSQVSLAQGLDQAWGSTKSLPRAPPSSVRSTVRGSSSTWEMGKKPIARPVTPSPDISSEGLPSSQRSSKSPRRSPALLPSTDPPRPLPPPGPELNSLRKPWPHPIYLPVEGTVPPVPPGTYNWKVHWKAAWRRWKKRQAKEWAELAEPGRHLGDYYKWILRRIHEIVWAVGTTALWLVCSEWSTDRYINQFFMDDDNHVEEFPHLFRLPPREPELELFRPGMTNFTDPELETSETSR